MGGQADVPFPPGGSSDGGKCGGTGSPPRGPVGTLCHALSACRDLSWNTIRSIHPEAFATLRSLVKL